MQAEVPQNLSGGNFLIHYHYKTVFGSQIHNFLNNIKYIILNNIIGLQLAMKCDILLMFLANVRVDNYQDSIVSHIAQSQKCSIAF